LRIALRCAAGEGSAFATGEVRCASRAAGSGSSNSIGARLWRMLGLGRVTAKEVYATLDWLGREQRFIEAMLARRHLNFLWPPSPRVDGSISARLSPTAHWLPASGR
jgi:hypothetical protein